MNLKEFLLSVDRTIQVEFCKLQHPGASLTKCEYVDERDDALTMLCSSPRKLHMLAEGLISGAAKRFETDYILNQCMHSDAAECKFDLKVAV